jgi:hypothetical protein
MRLRALKPLDLYGGRLHVKTGEEFDCDDRERISRGLTANGLAEKVDPQPQSKNRRKRVAH